LAERIILFVVGIDAPVYGLAAFTVVCRFVGLCCFFTTIIIVTAYVYHIKRRRRIICGWADLREMRAGALRIAPGAVPDYLASDAPYEGL
jgi:hypothetical protein